MTIKGPTAADLQGTLDRQVQIVARRVRAWTPADWDAGSTNPGWTNADTVWHLVSALTRYAHGVELRDQASRPDFPTPERPPTAHLAGRLQAAGERLVELLGQVEPTRNVWHPRYRFSARTMAAVALSEVVLHRWDLTGPGDRGPEPRAARLVLQGLFASQDDSGASPADLLLHVSGRRRIEGRPGWRGGDWQWELLDQAAAD